MKKGINEDRAWAEWSVKCLVCRRARKRQSGLVFRLVKAFEDLCPFCRAYERVYGRKSHQPVPKPPEAVN